MERAESFHAESVVDAWKAAATEVASAGGTRYVIVVCAGAAWVGSPNQLRAVDQAADGVGAEHPTAVANMLLPRLVQLSTGIPEQSIERGLRMLGRGRKRGLRFSTWTHTYFERMVGAWYDRFGVRREIKTNRLLGVIRKLNQWGRNAEAVFYIHTDIGSDNFRPRGSPCLQYIQFRAFGEKKLSVVGLYRAHDYTNKFLGNVLGLQRLGEFVAKHTEREYDGLCVISLHPFCSSKSQLMKFISDVAA